MLNSYFKFSIFLALFVSAHLSIHADEVQSKLKTDSPIEDYKTLRDELSTIQFTGKVSYSHTEDFSYFDKGQLEYVAPLGSMVMGSVFDSNGKVVKQGTLLLEINNDEILRRIASLRESINEQIIIADFYKKSYDRKKILHEKNAISVEALQKSQMDYMSTNNKIAELREQIGAEIAAEKTGRVYAPFSGIITRVSVSTQNVSSNASSTLTVSAISPMKVEINFPQKYIPVMDKFMNIYVYPEGEEKPQKATVFFKDILPGKLTCYVDNPYVSSVELDDDQEDLPRVSKTASFLKPVGFDPKVRWMEARVIMDDGVDSFIWIFSPDKNCKTTQQGSLRKVKVNTSGLNYFYGSLSITSVEKNFEIDDNDMIAIEIKKLPSKVMKTKAVYMPERTLFVEGQILRVEFKEI